MGRRGPKPENTALKLARGTYRAGRDAGRMDSQPPAGSPQKPSLDAVAGALWDRITAEHEARKTLGLIDTAALQSLCECWSLYRAALAEAQATPTDKDARIATLSYLAMVDKLGAKFGWTASDRSNLKLGDTASAPSSVSSFARRRSS